MTQITIPAALSVEDFIFNFNTHPLFAVTLAGISSFKFRIPSSDKTRSEEEYITLPSARPHAAAFAVRLSDGDFRSKGS